MILTQESTQLSVLPTLCKRIGMEYLKACNIEVHSIEWNWVLNWFDAEALELNWIYEWPLGWMLATQESTPFSGMSVLLTLCRRIGMEYLRGLWIEGLLHRSPLHSIEWNWVLNWFDAGALELNWISEWPLGWMLATQESTLFSGIECLTDSMKKNLNWIEYLSGLRV